MFVFIELVHN